MERERFLLAMAICIIFASFMGKSVVSAQTGSLSFGQPVYGYPGQTNIRIPVVYTSDVDLCAFQFVMDLEEGVLTFADPPVDTVKTVCGEAGPMFIWTPNVCNVDSQWFELVCQPSLMCDKLIPAESTGDTLFYIVVNVDPNATPGTETSLDLRDGLCSPPADNSFIDQSSTPFPPTLIDGNFQVTAAPNIVLIGNVPDENQPPPSGSSNWCAPTAAVNIIDYWDRVMHHTNAVGVMDNWTRGQASDHLGWFMNTNDCGSPRGIFKGDGHKGTYIPDEKLGLIEFSLWDTTWTFGHGKPDTSKRGRCWQVKTDYLGGWGTYKAEIDAGRPVKVDFMYWNPVPTGSTYVDTATGETIEVYSWGDTVNQSTDDSVDEQWDFVHEIGHAVTGVGYIANWDPDGGGPLPRTNYAIVHDNWPSTARNVTIPWNNWRANITVNPNQPPRLVAVLPTQYGWRGHPGDTLEIPWNIFNLGYEPDDYEILCTDSLGWDLWPELTLVHIDPCDGFRVKGLIAIPSLATPGSINRITLTAASQYKQLVRDSASVVLTVAVAPQITSITDVGNDQGKQVRVSWRRCDYDQSGSPVTITEYGLWRRIDSYKRNGSPEVIPSSGKGPIRDGKYPPGNWDFLKTVPARGESTYSTICPTLADSTVTDGMYWSVFFVSAMTSDPLVYYDSDPDSGYSLDNLAPSTPKGLMASSGDTSIDLLWNAIPDEDFRYYTLYRGTESGFTPDSSNLLGTTIDTVFSDIKVYRDSTYYYVVSALDFAGNESEHSNEVSCTFVGLHVTRAGGLPKDFSLSQNYPNPFNPVTEIKYALPRDSYVRLKVFNILGEEVTTLVDGEQKRGYKTVRWDAENVASGIYLYRLQAGNFTSVKKMILLK